MEKIRLGISTCLLGEPVRYDGGHKLDRFLTGTLGKFVEYIPVCPEVECGMGIPREPMRLEGEPENPRLVTIEGRVDKSGQMLSYCHTKMAELASRALCGFICKARSPSCGLAVDVYHGGVPAGKGKGLFAAALLGHFPFMPVVEEGGLDGPEARERFMEEVYGYYRKLNETL